MRIKKPVVTIPLHPGGLNNNQLRRNEQSQPIGEEIENRNETTSSTNDASVNRSPTSVDFVADEHEDFRIAEDTTTWSSLAITRENVQIDGTNENENLNNNLTVPGVRRNSSIESLADYEGRNSSREDSSRELTPSEWSDWSEEGNLPAGCRGIVNPNYPGFQHLAPSLLSDTDLTEDEHENCPDYWTPWLNDTDTRPAENDNEYNNNVEDVINYLCVQKNERKSFYEKPTFKIPTVTSIFESVLFKSIRSDKSADNLKEDNEKDFSTNSDVANETVEEETHQTVLETEEADEKSTESSTEKLKEEEEQEATVEIEINEFNTNDKEIAQFSEIEKIEDSGKTSETGEAEYIVVDLIREAKELPHQDHSKIGNCQTIGSNGSPDDSENNTDTDLTEDEHENCPNYIRLNDIDARPIENDNEYNNNVEDVINYLCVQKNERKSFYEKPTFNIPTVTSIYESVLLKSINYAESTDESKTENEKVFSAKSDVVNEVVEAETHQTVLEAEEALADSIAEEKSTELSTAKLEEKQEREVPVEIEIVELTTSVKETLQFPEIEEIPDSGKTSEIGETEDIVVEHIDLIREAKELPHQDRSKIGNRQTVTSNGSADDDSESNTDTDSYPEEQPTYTKLEEIDLLSSIGRDIGVDLEKYVQPVPDVVAIESMDSVHGPSRTCRNINMMKDNIEDTNKLLDRELPEASSADTRKKEKMARNQAKRRQQQQQQQQQLRSSNQQRRPDKRRADVDNGPGGFDVYNIETAMPKIDLDAIESHLRAAREEERRDDDKEPVKELPKSEETIASLQKSVESKEPEREDLVTRFDRVIRGDPDETLQRRNDREEIRRRLAMGPDAEDLRAERGRKPSLQSRLQSGMNLQICFMNETPSDTESPCSENDASPGSTPTSLNPKQPPQQLQQKQQMPVRPQVLSLPPLRLETGSNSAPIDEADFFARQARLQTEARMALAQAKEMAHMQMEVERQRLKQSPITEMVRCSLEKVGVQLGEDRRRLSRVLLTELNVAQLQVVANDLHARIAALNEALVEGLLRRDDLHMEQDSMLVDVEDLTRYLGAKQESLKKKQNARDQQTANRGHQQTSTGQNKSSLKPKLTHRGLVSLVNRLNKRPS